MKPNYKRVLNYTILVLQMVILVIAIDLGGKWLIIYLILNAIWAVYWSYNNWWLLKSVTEAILHMQLGKEYLDYKVKKSKEEKKKQKESKK